MRGFPAFLNILILLGALQGFIVSGLLWFSKKNQRPGKILAVLILLISLACFNLYGDYNDWFGSDLIRFLADIIPLVVIMPLGPLIYFYIKASTEPSFKLSRKQRPHFFSAVIDFVPSLIVIGYVIGIVLKLIKNNPGPIGELIDTYNVYADIPRWISLTAYLWYSARYLSAIKQSGNLPPNMQWLQQMVRVFTVFQGIWLLFLIPYIIPRYSNKLLDAVEWYPLYIPLALLIYWLGIKGFMAAQTSTAEKKAAAAQPVLSPAAIQQATLALVKSMEADNLYLNPALTVDAVAQHTGLPAKTISYVLNQHLQKSFNEFVNHYRVEAFKLKMLQPGADNLTIAGLAFDCGFNSLATFQRTFKQVTGMSPTTFRKVAPAMP
jgi:AraC-like DNA-binding protein